MKKTIFYLVAVLLFVGIAGLTSCEKYEVSTPYVINDSITATLTGYVYADLDQSNTSNEYAPAGTTLFIQVALSEYNPNDMSGEMKIYTTTVGSDGKYSFNLPSNEEGVSFVIIPDEFRTNQIIWDGSSEENVFTAASISGTAIASQTLFNDISYN